MFQDDKVIIPAGLHKTFVNLRHRDHARVQKMKDSAPKIIWKSMDMDLRREIHECVGSFQSGKNLQTNYLKPKEID